MELLDNLFTLLMLVLLQAVLGFDNLLYISIESGRAPADRQAYVRKLGIGLAIVFRIGLLFLLLELIDSFQKPVFTLSGSVVEGEFTIHSLVVLFGGVFILWTAMKEIWHILLLEENEHGKSTPKSVGSVLTLIIVMNVVFSFDSILSAIALTDVFWVMALAIVVGGLLMIWLADEVSSFLKRNRLYEVLGLFILFVVGIMLTTEGGHLAHLHLFHSPIMPMTKTTFYFVIVLLILTDVVQSQYQKRLNKVKNLTKKEEITYQEQEEV